MTSARTSDGVEAAFWPMLKKVALAPAVLRMLRSVWVLLPGPSSKVSAAYPALQLPPGATFGAVYVPT